MDNQERLLLQEIRDVSFRAEVSAKRLRVAVGVIAAFLIAVIAFLGMRLERLERVLRNVDPPAVTAAAQK